MDPFQVSRPIHLNRFSIDSVEHADKQHNIQAETRTLNRRYYGWKGRLDVSELIYHILQTWFGRLGIESEEGCMGADGCIGVLSSVLCCLSAFLPE